MNEEELEDDYWTMRETDAINNSIENKKLKQQVADLEAKLAEITEKYNACQEARKLESEFSQQDKKELIQQLAEKEEEIKQLNNRILFSQLQAPKEQILNILGSQCIQSNPEQDKITFTVEKLEKVKEKLEERIAIIKENEREGFCDRKQGLDMWQENKNAIKIIDNQIKQLKEGK